MRKREVGLFAYLHEDFRLSLVRVQQFGYHLSSRTVQKKQ